MRHLKVNTSAYRDDIDRKIRGLDDNPEVRLDRDLIDLKIAGNLKYLAEAPRLHITCITAVPDHASNNVFIVGMTPLMLPYYRRQYMKLPIHLPTIGPGQDWTRYAIERVKDKCKEFNFIYTED